MDCVLQRKIMWEEDSEMRWLRFEMKGMVDVQFIFIGRGLKKIMPAALTFCTPKRVLITYSCSKQRSEALSCPSLNSSIYRELHSLGLLAWFEFPFCRLGSEKYWFYFLFFYFFNFFFNFFYLTFKDVKWQWRMKIMVMTENLHDKYSHL